MWAPEALPRYDPPEMDQKKPTHSRGMARLSMLAQLNPEGAKRKIREALARAKNAEEGQARRAAEILGCSYETLWRTARNLGISDEMPRKGKGAGRPSKRGDPRDEAKEDAAAKAD